MANKFYLADWHYGHANVLHFDGRPWIDVNAMNAELIKNWNDTISDGDIVYVLGDMFWCKSAEAIDVLKQLKGQKFLIKGNHDRCNDSQFSRQFVKIDEYMEIEDDGTHIVLCHYPIPCFKNHLHDWYHLYGHVHATCEWDMMEHEKRLLRERHQCDCCKMLNVGVMMPYMNYKPRTFKEIISGAHVAGLDAGKE